MLVANRGEIAVRVIRGARALGVRAIAVFSEADRTAPHVLLADEACPIGPAPAAESYLAIDRLLAAAQQAGASAVHPGYGFLAERGDFAEAVEGAGMTFVGPPAAAIRAMGDKTEARRRMRAAGVPVVPGTDSPLASAREAEDAAREAGFPVVLKAAAGGGGKGMRVVRTAAEVRRAFEAAAREAQAAFGDGRVYVERFLERPRHVEVQVFADRQGNVVHLFERECSVQRRHQKLLEEAPSPLLRLEERERMGEAAVRAARAVEYVGAGTVEFLHHAGEFFFLEMNTRLQVEHPVTEMITGLDLVEWQLRVASGEPLPLRQEEVPMRGHAIECRVTSESPFDGFLPATGVVRELTVPGGPCVRWDGGVAAGDAVGLHYDPLLGKLVAHGRDRTVAVRQMKGALAELRVGGVSTCAPLLARILDEPDFLAGRLSTSYLDDHPELFEDALPDGRRDALLVAAAVLEHKRRSERSVRRIERTVRPLPAWRRAAAYGERVDGTSVPSAPGRPLARGGEPRGASSSGSATAGPARAGQTQQVEHVHGNVQASPAPAGQTRYMASLAGKEHDVVVGPGSAVQVDGRRREVSLAAVGSLGGHSLLIDGASRRLLALHAGGGAWKLELDGRDFALEVLDERAAAVRRMASAAKGSRAVASLQAPMPGMVVQVAVAEGDVVEAGDRVAIIEAMKMENELRAAAPARVAKVRVSPGQAVEKDQVLVEFGEAEGS